MNQLSTYECGPLYEGSGKTTWKDLISVACDHTGDDYSLLKKVFLHGDELTKFSDSFGSQEGSAFTAWSDDWVYFPVTYDGAEWVGWVPRNPCPIASPGHGG